MKRIISFAVGAIIFYFMWSAVFKNKSFADQNISESSSLSNKNTKITEGSVALVEKKEKLQKKNSNESIKGKNNKNIKIKPQKKEKYIPNNLHILVRRGEGYDYLVGDAICQIAKRYFTPLGLRYCIVRSVDSIEDSLDELIDGDANLMLAHSSDIQNIFEKAADDNLFIHQASEIKSIISIYMKTTTLLLSKKHKKVKQVENFFSTKKRIAFRVGDEEAARVLKKIIDFSARKNGKEAYVEAIAFSDDYEIIEGFSSGSLDGFVTSSSHPNQLISKLISATGASLVNFCDEIFTKELKRGSCSRYLLLQKVYNKSNQKKNLNEYVYLPTDIVELVSSKFLDPRFVRELTQHIIEEIDTNFEIQHKDIMRVDKTSSMQCSSFDKHQEVKNLFASMVISSIQPKLNIEQNNKTASKNDKPVKTKKA